MDSRLRGNDGQDKWIPANAGMTVGGSPTLGSPPRTIIAPMEIKSDNPDHGFQFPGTFELSAMGAAEKDLETVLPTLLLDAGIEVVNEISQLEALEQRPLRVGADQLPRRSREQYDLAHSCFGSIRK